MKLLILMQYVGIRTCFVNRGLFAIARTHLNTRNHITSTKSQMAFKLQTPELGDRVYEQLFLPNKIPVTLVQDSTSLKSSCALAVKVGASADPLPGIAHITEHAVFLGSSKYPVENAYKSFLNKNGGSSNAGTGMDHTTYKFDVNSGGFPHALDIFSQFFKCPLFDHNAMSREIMAVDSEDSKNRIIDARRFLQVMKNQMNPENDYTKFSTGNLNTLVYGDLEQYSENLTNTIRAFHAKHYKPENMAVCLVGPQTIDELKALSIEMFADIKTLEHSDAAAMVTKVSDSNAVDSSVPVAPITLDTSSTTATKETAKVSMRPLFNHHNKLIKIKPIKDIRDLTLLWEIPPTVDLYRNNPATLLSFLIGHKGEGSLFASLQDRKWATSTSAGVRTEFDDFSIFQVSISLTPEGLEHYDSIVAMINNYIEKIRLLDEGKLQSYWDEMKQCNALEFRFQEKASPYELATHVADNMLHYPLEHVLSAGYLLEDSVDFTVLKQQLSCLQQDKSLLFLRSNTFDSHPVDDVSYMNKLMNIIYNHNESVSSGDLQARKLSGEIFKQIPTAQVEEFDHRQREMTTQVESPSSPSTTTASPPLLHIEPFYGVHYELEDYTHITDTAKVSALMDSIHFPVENKFIGNIDSVPATTTAHTAIKTQTIDVDVDSDSNCLIGRKDSNVKLEHGGQQCSALSEKARMIHLQKSSPPVEMILMNETKSVPPAVLSAIWHSRDEMFRQPRSIAHCQMYSGDSCEDGHPVLSLIGQVFTQIAARKYYQSALAGLHYQMGFGKRGLGLAFYGFTPKLTQLAADVAADIGSATFWADNVDPELFEVCKERFIRNIKSWFKERPDSQANSLLNYLMSESAWLPQDRLNAVEATDLAYFHDRLASALKYDLILTYTHGNVESSDALALHKAVENNIPGSASVTTNGSDSSLNVIDKSRLLVPGQHIVLAMPAFNPEDSNSALVTHFQGDVNSPRNTALLMVLRRLLGEPCFTELRTKQQLGYIVSLAMAGYGSGMNQMKGLTVRILSKRFSPVHMQNVLGDFLTSQRTVLQSLSQTEIGAMCEALTASLKDPPTTYTEEASLYWDRIVKDMPFDWTEQVIAELQSVKHEDILQLAESLIYNANTRKSVSVMLFGNTHLTELSTVDDVSVTGGTGSDGGDGANVGLFGGGERKVLLGLDELTVVRDTLGLSGSKGANE